jgi:putative FmdB family regulatory protein
MPFYEYECSNCKFYTEVMQKITDAPLTKCPSCGKKALKKLVSAPNFRLKGGGWYETDFKGDKENKRNLAGAEKDDSSSASESTASASKPESPKTEVSKSEGTKTESGTGDSSSKPSKAAPTSGAASSGAESKSSSARRSSSGGRPAKPAVRVAAAKARPAPARSKSKPTPARKKARR